MSDQTEKSTEGQAPEKLKKVWPTLFIAVGGTGAEIALRVRRRLFNFVWGGTDNPVRIGSLSDFPLAQFINFDLDAGTVTESGQSAATDPLAEMVKFGEEEKLIFKLDMDKYLRTDGELNRFPLIASWFPLTRKKALELKIDPTKGAGQIRCLSRLYFFDKYTALKSMIEGKIDALLAGVTNKEKTHRLGLELEPASLRVVIIASTAGGTGSGAFLDMGYLAKWIAGKNLKGSHKVDLAMMLPSGYSGHGKSRTEANTYAALMEMETCVSQGIEYVKGWRDGEEPELPSRPFDDIFLFDTGNLASSKTAQPANLFDMVADILFEDFTSAEFANRKRSVSVNQAQYKIDSFPLPVDRAKYGAMNILYSKTFSAFGQSIIDTQLEQRRDQIVCEHVVQMLEEFFGIASDKIGNSNIQPPMPQEAREVLIKHANCGRDVFHLSYDFIKNGAPYEKGTEFGVPKLVGQLLYDGDQPMLGRLHEQINREINEILASTEKDQRRERVENFRDRLDRDLGLEGGATDAGARGLESAIQARRTALFNEMTDSESGLLKTLWAAVDDKERGGISFTIQLVEMIKDEIENGKTGLLTELEGARTWFSELCNKIRDDELQILRERLDQTRGKRWWPGGNSEAHAEAILQQIGEAIRWYADARLRTVACREAMTLLQELSVWMGEHRGMEEKSGRKRWSPKSFAGKLSRFEGLVVDIMSEMTNEMTRTREATKQDHPTYQVVAASMKKMEAARDLDPKTAMEWAKSVFANLGGSRKIFEKLEDEESRANLIGQLRSLSLAKLPSLGDVDQNPLTEALLEMSDSERKSLFQTCLTMAMPWVEADLEGTWTVNPDQYTCIIGVSGSSRFEKQFGDEFKAAIPTRARMTTGKIKFYETGVVGKLTCYVELSGIPLPSLSRLSDWRVSYNEEGKKIPVHTHKDKTRFVHPMALSVKALDQLAEHFKLFIQGVVTGVLKPRSDAPDERVYCLTVSGEELSIGNEKTIRMEGIAPDHLDNYRKKLNSTFDRVKTPAQHAALAILYEFYARRVYPPFKKRNENNVEILAEGFAHVLCAGLKSEAEKTARKKADSAGLEVAALNSRLEDELKAWTEEIEGSENDVYENEVGSSHGPKRVLRKQFFEPEWLERRFLSAETSQPTDPRPIHEPAKAASQPAPPPSVWWVALDGQKNGPHDEEGLKKLSEEGRLSEDTKVWCKGMEKWTPAGQVEALEDLFVQPPPLDDEPPPLDDEPPPID